jgi:hypothetical protein
MKVESRRSHYKKYCIKNEVYFDFINPQIRMDDYLFSTICIHIDPDVSKKTEKKHRERNYAHLEFGFYLKK